MNTTLVVRLGLVMAAASLVAACGGRPDAPPTDREVSLSGPVVEQRWNLLLVGTDERLSLPEPAWFRISSDGRVTGSNGCNQLMGQARLSENQRIEFSQLGTTRRACPQGEDAARVIGMLETAYRYLIDHDRLVFFGPDKRVLGGWRKAN
ncbi:MAG: META domain-containing protein [Halomonas sp.]|uniref:META domain-containing protein n=1 Tax=Halomonas sp. TaxID=1486246 RepID=UPI003970AA87